ncbi:MAG: CoA transferase [Rhodobacteraceae bacterium]|nr:CoA transferase [Paracoccaceae bacterium]
MLSGIRIVEVEGLGPGPFASMLLADLGADVIVVHRKGGKGFVDKALIDRGKRSIALDLKDADDIATLRKLVARADGLIEGFRPGVMERLGIGPVECHAFNPALVFGRMTGWGQEGPLRKAAGHDMNYIAMSGALWYAAEPGQLPMAPPTLVGDVGGGAMYLAVGMLAGLLNARATGKGTVVDAAIYDGSAHMMNLLLTMRQAGGLQSERGQSLLDGPHWSHAYRTADGGFMSVQCLEPQFYAQFLELLGLTGDAGFAEQNNPASWPTLTDRLRGVFAGKTRAEWTEIFEGTDACVAPVLNPEEAMAHPLNTARDTWREVGGVLQTAPAPRFSGQEPWQPVPSPARDQHRQEILDEIT